MATAMSQDVNTPNRMISTLLKDWPGNRTSGCSTSKGATMTSKHTPVQAIVAITKAQSKKLATGVRQARGRRHG